MAGLGCATMGMVVLCCALRLACDVLALVGHYKLLNNHTLVSCVGMGSAVLDSDWLGSAGRCLAMLCFVDLGCTGLG